MEVIEVETTEVEEEEVEKKTIVKEKKDWIKKHNLNSLASLDNL